MFTDSIFSGKNNKQHVSHNIKMERRKNYIHIYVRAYLLLSFTHNQFASFRNLFGHFTFHFALTDTLPFFPVTTGQVTIIYN